MFMKLTINKLAAACTLALTGGVAQANLLSDFGAGDIVIYAGGATATDGVLENLARASVGGYCDAGTIDIYTGANQRAIFCTSTSRVSGIAAGSQIAFLKESAGGSSNGVVPLIAVGNGAAHALQWLDLAWLRDNSGCTTVALLATDTTETGLLDVTRRWNCAGTGLLTAADTSGSATFDVNMGISDTEPALSSPPPSSTDQAKISSKAGIHIVFGVAVNEKLYRALQRASGKSTDNTAANMPSLTEAQVRGLYSGALQNWDQILVPGTSPQRGLVANEGVVAGGDPPTAQGSNDDGAVYMCRRVASSGTQATAESYWFSQRCISGGTTFRGPSDGSSIADTAFSGSFATGPVTIVGNQTVNAAPSSGNVRTCLANLNAADVWAVGVLSHEVTGSHQSSGVYMVGINGVGPSLANTANGKYGYYSENVTTVVADGNPGALAATDPRRIVIEHIRTNLSEPVSLAATNTTFVGRPWGDGGSMAIENGLSALVNSPQPVTPSQMISNPVNSSTKFGNNCVHPVASEPSAVPIF
jgi:hypothetical protein